MQIKRNTCVLPIVCIGILLVFAMQYLTSSDIEQDIESQKSAWIGKPAKPSRDHTRFHIHSKRKQSKRICTQDERKAYIDTICKSLKLNITSRIQFVVDDRHRLAYCYIPKAASSTFKRLLMLSQGTGLKGAKSSHKREVLESFGLRFTNDLNTIQNYTKFMIVRNPYSRFVSAYENKMATDVDKSDIFQYYRTKLRSIYESGRNATDYEPIVLLKTFVKFMLTSRSAKRLRRNEHWMPYTYLCNPCDVQYDYILRTETLRSDASLILKHLNLTTADFQWATKNVHSHNQEHISTDGNNASYLDQSIPQLDSIDVDSIHALQSVYWREDALFGYDIDASTKTAECGIGMETGDVCC